MALDRLYMTVRPKIRGLHDKGGLNAFIYPSHLMTFPGVIA